MYLFNIAEVGERVINKFPSISEVIMNSDKSNSATIALVQNLIQDLVNAGMSYSRISTRLGLSPSTIQKIVAKDRMPRMKTLINIGSYYVKIFESPQSYGVAILTYYTKYQVRIKNLVLQIKHQLAGWSLNSK